MTDPSLPVYRLVDGELVRIPGDKREPNRRYSHVSGPEGSYLREFTNEEENQRDAEEATWAAERPMRDAEAIKRAEENERFRQSLKYQSRVIAFLDILGWRDAIQQSLSHPALIQQLGIALDTFKHQTRMAEWTTEHGGDDGWPGDPQITHFSDSIALSVIDDRHAELHMQNGLWSIVHRLLELGFFVRGGIARGLLIHKGAMVYGPALIEAYELEKNVSSVPRIVLSFDLKNAWISGVPVSEKDGTLLGYFKYWRTDREDGRAFYDFLQPFPLTVPVTDSVRASYKQQLNRIRPLIVDRLAEHKNCASIHEKYQWLGRYFNELVDEYAVTADKIPIL